MGTMVVTFWKHWSDGRPTEKSYEVMRIVDLHECRQLFERRMETPVTSFGCDTVSHIRFWMEAK